MLNLHVRIQDAGYKMQDAGCRMQDSGYKFRMQVEESRLADIQDAGFKCAGGGRLLCEFFRLIALDMT